MEFSKRELIAVVLFTLIGLSVGLPYVLKSRSIARGNTCQMQLAELAQAAQRAEQIHRALPGYRAPWRPTEVEQGITSWVFPLLPFAALKATPDELQSKLFPPNRFGRYAALHERWRPGQDASGDVRLSFLICPDVPPSSLTKQRMHYVVNCGQIDAPATETAPADSLASGVMHDRMPVAGRKMVPPSKFEQIEKLSGTSYTLLFAENADAGEWTSTTEPQLAFVWKMTVKEGILQRDESLLGINQLRGQGDGSYAFARPSSYHRLGVNVAYCDGRTAFLDQRVDDELFMRFMTVDDTQLTWPGTNDLMPEPYCLPPRKPAEEEEQKAGL